MVTRSRGSKGEEGAFVCEGSGASFCCSEGGRCVRGGRIAEDEEFDKGTNEDYDG